MSCLSNDTNLTIPVGEEIRGLAHHSAPVVPLLVVPTSVFVSNYEGDINLKSATNNSASQLEAKEFIASYVFGDPTDQQSVDLLNGLSAEALAVVREIGENVANGGL